MHRHAARYLHLLGGYSCNDANVLTTVLTGVDVYDTWTGLYVRFIPAAEAPLLATSTVTQASHRNVFPRSTVLRCWAASAAQRARNAGSLRVLTFPRAPDRDPLSDPLSGGQESSALGEHGQVAKGCNPVAVVARLRDALAQGQGAACGWGGVDARRDEVYVRRGINRALCRAPVGPLQGAAIVSGGATLSTHMDDGQDSAAQPQDVVHRIALVGAGPCFAPSLASPEGMRLIAAMTAGSALSQGPPVTTLPAVRPAVLAALIRMGYEGDVDWEAFLPFVLGRQDLLSEEALGALAKDLAEFGIPAPVAHSTRGSLDMTSSSSAAAVSSAVRSPTPKLLLPWYSRTLRPSTARMLALLSLTDSRMRTSALESVSLRPPRGGPGSDAQSLNLIAYVMLAWSMPYALAMLRRQRAHATLASDTADFVASVARDGQAVARLQSAAKRAASVAVQGGLGTPKSLADWLQCRASVTCYSASDLARVEAQARAQRPGDNTFVDPIEILGAICMLGISSPVRAVLEQALVRVATVDSLPVLLAAARALSLPRLAGRLMSLASAVLPVLLQTHGDAAKDFKKLVCSEMQAAVVVTAATLESPIAVLPGSIALISLIEPLLARQLQREVDSSATVTKTSGTK